MGLGEIRGQASFMAEFRGGVFAPEIKKFKDIYGNDEFLPSIVIGVGGKQTYLVARYNLYEKTGKSIITGVELDGDAQWKQEIITIGVRSYDQKPLYVELAYAMGKAEETISTETPEYTALNSSWTSSDVQGGALAIGVNVPVALGFQICAEINYIYLPVTMNDDDKINIGGRQLSLGLTWKL